LKIIKNIYRIDRLFGKKEIIEMWVKVNHNLKIVIFSGRLCNNAFEVELV